MDHKINYVGDPKLLPQYPTRKMWAAMSEAYIDLHRGFGVDMGFNPDVVSEALYKAAWNAASKQDAE